MGVFLGMLSPRSSQVRGHGGKRPHRGDPMRLNPSVPRRGGPQSLILFTLLAAMTMAFAGCRRSEPAADPEPFRVAVEQYLQQHDMALRLKEIRKGPTVTGAAATMSVSLTHAELGGPSVVWEFQFERDARGEWRATSHRD
ncbi:MAG: hypothetical protein ACYC6N_22020 [Pirellulaceae bacterium]